MSLATVKHITHRILTLTRLLPAIAAATPPPGLVGLVAGGELLFGTSGLVALEALGRLAGW